MPTEMQPHDMAEKIKCHAESDPAKQQQGDLTGCCIPLKAQDCQEK